MPNPVLKLDPKDNVLVALRNLDRGERIDFEGQTYELASNVPAKHKFATEGFAPGSHIIMYGVLVGTAREPIQRGELLSTRNIAHATSPFDERGNRLSWTPPDVNSWRDRTFRGFLRSDGQVGTRNYWIVVPLVFCENRNIHVLKQAFEEELGFAPPQVYRQQLAELILRHREGKPAAPDVSSSSAALSVPRSPVFPNIDGVKFLTHEGGCGGTREDARNLCALIAGYIHHPNVAGATILSLGCQHSQIEILHEEIQRRNPRFDKPLLIFDQQQTGSEFQMMSRAIRATFEGLVAANNAARSAASLSHLCVGLKCGGSDGFSGISANPALGRVSDVLVACGARTILSEFPELCGVEQNLIDRSINPEVSARFIHLMRDYAARAIASRSALEMNPSPGNIKDGLLTDAMKSAGAARKGGTSPVTAVLDYPEYCTQPGLNLQCTPGNDVECVTAQTAAGASIVLFTTGLGTPTGNPIAPVIKISTNSALAHRMHDIIDLDAGSIIAREKTIPAVADELISLIVKVASGEHKTKAESLAQNDFIPWKRGVSL